MNIIIVGQGAIGLLWYHHLQQMIHNHDSYSKMQLHILPSLQVTRPRDQYTFTDHKKLVHKGIINYAKTENVQNADFIIFCVKAFQLSSALSKISDHLKNNVGIICAHNGMGTLPELPTEILKKNNIYTLLTTHGCLRTRPLQVTHTGVGVTDIGLISGVTNLVQQKSLTQLLNSALPQVTFHQKIEHKQWVKLAINCAINPLTAINNINNGEINNSKYLTTIQYLLEEVVIIAEREGVTLQVDLLKKIVANVAQATAKNSSSMRCDILANRKSEIDYINGYIHYLGVKYNIATPENTKMWQTVKALV